MVGNQAGDKIGVRAGEAVVATGHDFEAGIRDPRLEMPPHRDWTDGIGIAPDQQGWGFDLLDRLRR